MTTYLSPKQGQKIVRLVIIGLIAILALVAYTFYQSYVGRVDLVNAQNAECARAKLDRQANAKGWRTAQTARLETLSETLDISFVEARRLMNDDPNSSDPPDLVAVRDYNQIAAELEARSRIDCTKAVPEASLLP